MVKRLYMLALFFAMLSAGCDRQSFTPIPERMNALISINIKDGSASFFDLDKQTKYAEWNVREPVKGGVLLNKGDTLLLYGSELDRAYEYELATGRLKREWKVGKGIVNALVSRDGRRVFLADGKQKAIRLFRMDGKEVGAIPAGRAPLTLVQSRDGARLYVVDFQDAKVEIIDVRKWQLVGTFSVPKASLGGLLREEKQEIWIGGHGSGSTVETAIRVYSLPEGKLAKTISAPDMPISFAETEEGIFALSHGSNTVRKWNRSGGQEGALEVGANPFALIGTDRHLYVASYDSDEIAVIDGRTLRVVQQYKTGKGPFQLLVREE